MAKKKPTKGKTLNVYANLSHRRKTKKDAAARKRAEYLATLPKHPVKRFFYRLHPKRVAKYWFSKRGALMAVKILGVMLLVMAITVGALFAYFRKDLDQIRPGELAKRVQTTVSKYYDRNDQLLWEDKGDGNYKLVVESNEISQYLKDATVAIEDRDFYKHHGVSPSGVMRALVNNTGSSGGGVQGGSTLTQQLVKQVFFADEAQERGLAGIPRKIKEMILSVEVERMYDKDQILALYLNESPYGGRRNGAESGAQTYFGKPAKDLSLAEAALLAAIPQNPSLFDPYNINGHEGLIVRQHTVLDYMADQGFVTKQQADEAKKVAILDTIRPLSDQYKDIKAPHFVQMVRAQLEQELGKATVGKGGLTVKTTIDIRVQEKLEAEMTKFFDSGVPANNGISNGAATVEDSQTGQIVALLGSRDFNYQGYGQDNAATAFIQPGSTVKPFVFAKLFEDKGSGQQNYGSGSVLKDERIDAIYGAKLNNWDNKFMGNITARQGLGLSRNIPAVKAMYINGVQPTIDKIREIGNTSYCTQEAAAGIGLASAIGACGAKQTELVNAFATLSRQGTYKPITTVLEVRNSENDVVKKWEDQSKQVLDPQISYILSDILSDPDARAALHGRNPLGLTVNGVRVAGKTGTSDRDSKPKDLWIMTYSTALTMGLWLGNSDTSNIRSSNSVLGGAVVSNVMEFAHKNVYAPEGKWKSGDWFTQPAGVQKVGKELYPSWWNKNQGQSNTKLTFDKVSKFKATSCTPEGAKIEIAVTKSVDPVTKKDVFIAPDGYDANKDDDKHKCDDAKPTVSINPSLTGHAVTVTVSQGTFSLSTLEVRFGDTVVASRPLGAGGTFSIDLPAGTTSGTVSATVVDSGFYSSSDSKAVKAGS